MTCSIDEVLIAGLVDLENHYDRVLDLMNDVESDSYEDNLSDWLLRKDELHLVCQEIFCLNYLYFYYNKGAEGISKPSYKSFVRCFSRYKEFSEDVLGLVEVIDEDTSIDMRMYKTTLYFLGLLVDDVWYESL